MVKNDIGYQQKFLYSLWKEFDYILKCTDR